ncbi:MAG TPA: LysR family transcriptional regulator [Tepidiformaceae bacterium]|nr:LysR family transcriptional regulator [Tepidiformaceae bacterium]
MELAQLEAFIAASDCGSFSRAAELLNVAQPSLSNRIQSLEREVGQPLFERMGRGVKLTDSGHAFLPYAQRVLRTLHDGIMVLEGTRNGTAGQIMIGTAPAVGTYVLPKVLKVFCERHEGVDVLVRTGHSDEVLQMVLDDDVQVGFSRPVNHPDVRTIVLYEDTLVLVVASSHRYAKRGTVTVEELADESLILFDRDSGYYGLILGLFRDLGVVPHQQMQLDSIEATKKMVESNLGIALLPEVAVEREMKLGTLHKVHIESAAPVKRAIAIMYRRNKPQSGPMAAFLDLLGQMYGMKLPR